MENLKKVDLEPVVGRQKSFYGKAKILIDSEGNTFLKSYDSIIAEVKNNTDVYIWDSQNSLKHLKSFLHILGFEIGTKQQLIEMYS